MKSVEPLRPSMGDVSVVVLPPRRAWLSKWDVSAAAVFERSRTMRGIETIVREGKGGLIYRDGCTAACDHVDPDGLWPHEIKLLEDAGEIHTDDCGFMFCQHNHDPGMCCTAGRQDVKCRVGLGDRHG